MNRIVGDGEDFEDYWFGVKKPREPLARQWTGRTVFKLKPRESRESENPVDMEEDEDLFEKLFDSPAVDEDEPDRMTLQRLKEEDEKKKVRVVEEPREPTADEVQEHELHHANFEPWCKVCVEGQGKERAHRRQQEDPREHIIYSDYMYFTKDGKQKPKEEVEKSKDADDLKGLAIVLTAIDKDSQCPFAVQVPGKGTKRSVYSVNAVMEWIKSLGWKKVTIQIDQESALSKVFEQVQQRMGVDVVAIRKSPRYSSQSLADGEVVNGLIAGKVRTWIASMRDSYSEQAITTTDIMFPWIIRFVSWSLQRFHVNQSKTTPFRVLNGYDYIAECLPFGECALGKYSPKKSGVKSASRWVCGVCVGKTNSSDEHILLTSAGAQTFRTVRRMTYGRRFQMNIFDQAAGVPWDTTFRANGSRPDHVRSEVNAQSAPEASPGLQGESAAMPPPSGQGLEGESAATPPPSGQMIVVAPPVSQPVHATQRQAESLGGEARQIDADMEPEDVKKRETAAPGAAVKHRKTNVAAEAKAAPRVDTAPAEAGSPTSDLNYSPSGSGDGSSSSSSDSSRFRSRHSGQGGAAASNMAAGEAPTEPSAGATAMDETGQQVSAIAGGETKEDRESLKDQLASVADYLDSCVVDLEERNRARLEEINKLDEMFKAFTPRDRRELPKDIRVFGHCWVDKVSNSIVKSRLTCQDFKKINPGDKNSSEGPNNFCPTPGHSTTKLLEIYSLYHNFPRVKADLTSAFLIARDGGDEKGQPVCMKPPREWLDHFDEWLAKQSDKVKNELKDVPLEHLVWQVDGNIYGRQPAASQYRDKLEDIIVNNLPGEGYDFVRGKLDGCVFRCHKTKVAILHHIDDFAVTGPEEHLDDLLKVQLPKYGCKVKVGEMEYPDRYNKTSSEFLGRTKINVEEAVLTKPNEKHTDNILKLLGLENCKSSPVPGKKLEVNEKTEKPLSESEKKVYQSCVGSAIYLSQDRIDIKFSVKELSRRMKEPRYCDMANLKILGRYLKGTKHLGHITKIENMGDTSSDERELPLHAFCDSDYAGDPGSPHPEKSCCWGARWLRQAQALRRATLPRAQGKQSLDL